MFKRKENNIDILNIIYPQKCGICGKINQKPICNKCEMKLKAVSSFNIETKESNNFDELIYLFRYESLIRKLIIDYKFNEKSYLYKTLVYFCLKNRKIFEKIQSYDTIVPVPISKKRMKERGYNQSLLIAKEIAINTNLTICNKCLIKSKNIIEQSKLGKEERQKNIKGVYKLKSINNIKNKKILLIDDIFTTGSTVNECSKILKQGQPQKIDVFVLSRD